MRLLFAAMVVSQHADRSTACISTPTWDVPVVLPRCNPVALYCTDVSRLLVLLTFLSVSVNCLVAACCGVRHIGDTKRNRNRVATPDAQRVALGGGD